VKNLIRHLRDRKRLRHGICQYVNVAFVVKSIVVYSNLLLQINVFKMALKEQTRTKLHLSVFLKAVYYIAEHLELNALKLYLNALCSLLVLQQMYIMQWQILNYKCLFMF
jgi:hypothetical protein